MSLLPISLVFYRTGIVVKQYHNKETLQLATICHPPMDVMVMQYCIRRSGVSSLSSGVKSIPVFQDTVQRSEAGIASSHLVLKDPGRAPKMKGCC